MAAPIRQAFAYDKFRNQGSISGVIDRGYFVKPPYPSKEGNKNATLYFQHTLPSGDSESMSVTLFVQDISVSMSLEGTTAQSRNLRQFYAHNLNIPEMVVTCQARSNYEYSYVAEFIRFTQKFLVSNYDSSGTATGRLVKFVLNPNRVKYNATKPRSTRAVTYTAPDGTVSRHLPPRVGADGFTAGSRQGFDILCYITDITRETQVGENAVEFKFNVTIVDVNSGGLPFSKNDSATNSIEGIQWTYEQIDRAPTDLGYPYFVKDPNISVINKTSKKKEKAKVREGKPQPPPPVGSTLTSVTSSINTLVSNISNIF